MQHGPLRPSPLLRARVCDHRPPFHSFLAGLYMIKRGSGGTPTAEDRRRACAAVLGDLYTDAMEQWALDTPRTEAERLDQVTLYYNVSAPLKDSKPWMDIKSDTNPVHLERFTQLPPLRLGIDPPWAPPAGWVDEKLTRAGLVRGDTYGRMHASSSDGP